MFAPDHTQWHTHTHACSRTPLDKGSAHHRVLYLTTHIFHKRQPCPRRDSNPQFQKACGRRPTRCHWDRHLH